MKEVDAIEKYKKCVKDEIEWSKETALKHGNPVNYKVSKLYLSLNVEFVVN